MKNIEERGYRKEPNCTKQNYKKIHYCELIEMSHLYGPAINDCYEDQDGLLFISNGEYGSQVNFCPICGYEAKIKLINAKEE